MKGWKTWVSAIGTFCTGIAMLVSGLVGDVVDPDKVYQGILICAGALGIVGIGHKIEKGAK